MRFLYATIEGYAVSLGLMVMRCLHAVLLLLFLLGYSSFSHSDDKPLIVCSEQNYPPFALGLTDASADGFTVELWRAVAIETHLTSIIHVKTFHEILEDFKAGKCDVLINLAQSDARHQFADFTVPHVIVNGAIFVREGETRIHAESDLNDKRIIVLNGDLAHDYALSQGWEKQLVLVDNAEIGFKLLASGQNDLMLLSKLAGQQTLESLAIDSVVALPIKVGFAQKFSFAVQKGNAELLAKINEGLSLTKSNGTYDKLYEKWFGIYQEKDLFLLLIQYLTPIIVFFLLIISLSFYRRTVERKRTMQALQKSEIHYRNTFEYAPIGVVNIALNGHFLKVNQTYCDIVGYSRKELLMMNIMDVIKVSDRVHHTQLMQQLLTGEIKRIYAESQYIHKDKSLIWGRLSVQLSCHIDDAPDYFIATIEDITERKAIEQQLNILSVAVEQSPASVVITDLDANLLYVNPQFMEATGYCAEEVIGKNPHILQSGLTSPDTYQQLWNTLTQGNIWHGELINRRKNGEIYWEEAHIAPVKNSLGVITHYVGVKLDITNRKYMEQQWRDSEAFTNSILNSLTSHIAVLDAQGAIIAVNKAWQQFAESNGLLETNYAMLGKNYLAVCKESINQPHGEEALAAIRGIESVLAGHTDNFNLEYPCHSLTEQRWFDMRVSPLQGEQQGVVISHENITQRKQTEEILKASETRFRTIIDISPVPMVLNDEQQNITFLNAAFIQTFGYELSDISTLDDWWLNAYPDSVYRQWVIDNWQAKINQVEREHCTFIPLELIIRCKNGTKKTVLISAAAIHDGFNDIHLMVLYDISERKRAEAELHIAATVFESQEGMIITDTNGNILRVNKAFTQITGYSENEVFGKNPRLWSSGKQDTAFYNELWQQVYDTGAWQGEIWNRRKNGEVYPEWLTITAVKANNDDVVTHYVATLTDITERKTTEERINQLAFYDALTQLPNRRLLYERLKHGIDLSHRTGNFMAVLMLDLDKFKVVNDSFGHTAGDELLQHVAERTKSCLREIDTVARLGGDEFVILITNISHHEVVARIAENIIETLIQPFILTDNRIANIGASIGIAIYPKHGDNVETLIDNADTALYFAKEAGRCCFAYFSEELTQKARKRIALESRLRKAIELQELQVYFQAQIDVVSGQMMGAEALVRWNDGVNGLIMPSNFIELAEDTGLIVPLGEFVLRETCRLGKQWLEQGLPAITLAVNVSPYQFRRCDISALVAEILEETGFPASLLELEITESGLMENQQQAMTILDNLHKLGVRLAIDDFGTGYSSLSYLKFFPLDVLKIDKSFIDDIPILASDMAITATIIGIAHHLGFKVLAEGVETIEQLAFLQQQGCDLYQGYLYSKPLSVDDFTKQLLSLKVHNN